MLFFVLGLIFLGLGIAGTVLPVLPGGPFYLIASYCFAKSSERVANWFKRSRFYPYVERYYHRKEMTRKEKIRINLIADAFILFSIFYVRILLVQLLMIALALYKHYYFYKKIKTIPPQQAALSSDIDAE